MYQVVLYIYMHTAVESAYNSTVYQISPTIGVTWHCSSYKSDREIMDVGLLFLTLVGTDIGRNSAECSSSINVTCDEAHADHFMLSSAHFGNHRSEHAQQAVHGSKKKPTPT